MIKVICVGSRSTMIAALLANLPEVSVEDTKVVEIKTYGFADPPVFKEPTDYKPVIKRGKGKVKKW